MNQKIEITIIDGKLSIEAVGFNGVGCDAATKFLEELGKLTDVTKKPEYDTREGGHRVES